MSGMKTILLIDDEADLVFMLQGILTQAGYRVVTARNGEEGLAKLKAVVPHLIILDMNMPKMGGVAFYHAIASHYDSRTSCPVLILTARSNLEKLFKDLCVDGFMTKPFEIDDLLKEVRTILHKRYEQRAEIQEKREHSRSGKLLIIEDDQQILGQMVLFFATHSYSVSGTQSGADGIERAIQDPPDLILIKLGLPNLSGDMTASILRQMPKTMDIPLILYAPAGDLRASASIHKICERAKVKNVVGSNDPELLLKEVEEFSRN